MTIFFIDGFDKYGSPVQATSTSAPAGGFYNNRLYANLAGEWTSVSDSSTVGVWLDQPLAGSGASIAFGSNTSALLNKSLPANYARLIGGFRFKITNFSFPGLGCQFLDGTSNQAQIKFTSSGTIQLLNAASTVIATSVASFAQNTTHYLEFDITFNTTGAYNIYLDGVNVLSGTGNFKTTNAYANVFKLGTFTGINTSAFVDDLYLDDGTGSVLLTSPYVITEGMSSDNTVQFSPGAAILGDWELITNSNNAPGANFLFLRKFTPSQAGSLASVSCSPQATSGTAKFKAVVYSDNAGVPNALLATGNEVVGTGTAAFNNNVTSAFGAPPALTAGTGYWIGFITDTSVVLSVTSTLTTVGVKAANTYTSGAPGTAPAMTTAQPNWAIWGALTGVTSHTAALAQVPNSLSMGGDFSYVTDLNVGDEDLLNVTPLAVAPSQIHAVAVKGVFRDAAAGARTVTLQQKSGATDSASPALTPVTTYQWFGGYWPTDPNGAIPWTKTNLDAALVGFRIAS